MSEPPEQLALVRTSVRTTKGAEPPRPAADRPVARVAVAVPLAHLDRPFDYLVPEPLADHAVPGARVVVRFAGRQVSGFVLERVASSDHEGRLAPLVRAPSDEVVLDPDVARLCRQVADRYAGTFSDVVRLAVPPRHARVEGEDRTLVEPGELPELGPGTLAYYESGPGLLEELAAGDSPRACWTLLPRDPWPDRLAEVVLATARSGRGAIVCVPDARDVARLDRALTDRLGPGHHAVLTADLGPAARYRAFLSLSRGQVRIAIGTRAAAFAPVRDVGLVAIWDDGDDLHSEPRAPYPHAREVLLLRARDLDAAVVLAGYARSTEAQALVRSGWCTELDVTAEVRRRGGPRVIVAGSAPRAQARDAAARSARLPSDAHHVIREALESGPVLVQVPRAGYRPSLVCQDCREPARCPACRGPLSQSRSSVPPACMWCGALTTDFSCPHCAGTRLRSPVVGDQRTAEELGRTFSPAVVRTSSGDRVLATVGAEPAIVVATPGAEPVAEGGYAAGVLMDTWLQLGRLDLRSAEEALRRWFAVAALVRPDTDGGRLVVIGDPSIPAVQALVRSDPVTFAERELDDRFAARLPPAVRLATVTGPASELEQIRGWTFPQPVDILGPVPVDEAHSRLVIRAPRAHGAVLARALRELQGQRSARKATALRVQIDPLDVG